MHPATRRANCADIAAEDGATHDWTVAGGAAPRPYNELALVA